MKTPIIYLYLTELFIYQVQNISYTLNRPPAFDICSNKTSIYFDILFFFLLFLQINPATTINATLNKISSFI